MRWTWLTDPKTRWVRIDQVDDTITTDEKKTTTLWRRSTIIRSPLFYLQNKLWEFYTLRHHDNPISNSFDILTNQYKQVIPFSDYATNHTLLLQPVLHSWLTSWILFGKFSLFSLLNFDKQFVYNLLEKKRKWCKPLELVKQNKLFTNRERRTCENFKPKFFEIFRTFYCLDRVILFFLSYFLKYSIR